MLLKKKRTKAEAAGTGSSASFERLNGRGLNRIRRDFGEGLGDEGGDLADGFISMKRRARRLPQGEAYIAPIGLVESLAGDTTFGNAVDGHISRVGQENGKGSARSELGTTTLEHDNPVPDVSGEHPPVGLDFGETASQELRADTSQPNPENILDALCRGSGLAEESESAGGSSEKPIRDESTLPEMLRDPEVHKDENRPIFTEVPKPTPNPNFPKTWQNLLMMANPAGKEWRQAVDGEIPECMLAQNPPVFYAERERAAAQPTLLERAREWFNSYREPIFATAALAVVTCITMFSFLGRRSRASAPPSPSLSAPSLSARIDTTPKVTTDVKAPAASSFSSLDLSRFNPERMTLDYGSALVPNLLPPNSEYRTFALTNGPTWTDTAIDPMTRRWREDEDISFFTRRRGKPNGQGM